MWGFVKKKAHPLWLWHTIDHHSGHVLAYVSGCRQDTVFLPLQVLLEPFGIIRYYTDGWGAYERHLDGEKYQVGKEHTQKSLMLTDFVVTVSSLPSRKQSKGYATSGDDTGSR